MPSKNMNDTNGHELKKKSVLVFIRGHQRFKFFGPVSPRGPPRFSLLRRSTCFLLSRDGELTVITIWCRWWRHSISGIF